MISVTCPKCGEKFGTSRFPVPLELRCPACRQLLRLHPKIKPRTVALRRFRQFCRAHRAATAIVAGIIVIGGSYGLRKAFPLVTGGISEAILSREANQPAPLPAVKPPATHSAPAASQTAPAASQPAIAPLPGGHVGEELQLPAPYVGRLEQEPRGAAMDRQIGRSLRNCLSAGDTPAKALSPEALFAAVSPAVARVSVMRPGQSEAGFGSGFLISSDGLLVTNYHVIRDAWWATARLPDGRLLNVAGIVAVDPRMDLALLKTDAGDTPRLELSAAPLPAVGAKVYAIGSPQGLFNTFSEGMISGHRVPLSGPAVILQTTAPVSKGSSGGPLVSPDGRVVGICYQVFRDGQNLNFAIPAPTVRNFLAQAMRRAGGGASGQ